MSALGRVVATRATGGDEPPALAFVVPVFDPPIEILRANLASIDAQTFDRWECVVADDASRDPAVRDLLDRWASTDRRHRLVRRATNGGIAAATNDAIEHATGQIVAFVDHDDLVDPTAAAAVVDHFERHPDHGVVYTDERVIDERGNVLADHFKPDYSPIRHLGQHYLAHLVAARIDAIGELRVRSDYEPAQDVDFLLRVIERGEAEGRGVGHIAQQLYSWRAMSGSSALAAGEKPGMSDAVLRSVDAALERRGIAAGTTVVEHDGRPTTSIRITPDGPLDDDVVTVSVDAHGTGADVAPAFAEAAVVVLEPAAPTDWPTDWSEPLRRTLLLPDVAAAGPILVDGGGHLASVGRTVDPRLRDVLRGTADGPGPWGAFFVHREVSALAPWGLVLDADAVRSVGGVRPDLGIDAAVAELCGRLRAAGKAVVCSPSARLPIDPASTAPDRRRDDDWAVVRSGGIDDPAERFDVTGVAPVGAVRASAWDEARDLIATGAVSLVTTDVFDTLVTRPVSRPVDLFVRVADRLHDTGSLDPSTTTSAFVAARRDAERRARAAEARRLRSSDDGHRSPEVTLEEIWAELGPVVGVDPVAGIDAELTTESDHLRPIREAIEVLRSAHERSIPVVAVSDIYLSSDRLTDLLARAGVPTGLFTAVVTSSDRGYGKADGLLADVIDDAGVEPSSVLHLGDNRVADLDTAEQLGALARLVELPAHHEHVPRPGRAVADVSRLRGADAGLHAAIREVLVAEGSLGADPGFQFGAVAAGPAIVGFARWAAVTTERLGATTLHCLLREGAEIARLIGIVAPEVVTTRLVHSSRWVTMRAACIDATPDQLYTALARRSAIEAAHVERAFGCDADEVARIWGTDVVLPSELMVACEHLAADDVLRSQIVDSAARLRAGVVRQLHRELADGEPLVLCDVGWGGTIQEGIQRILASVGDDRPIVGLYLALSAPGEERRAAGADMRAYLPDDATDAAASRASRVISHHADSIERVLTPELATLVDVDVDGTPVLAPSSEYQPPSLLAARFGIEQLARRLAAHGTDDDVLVDDLDMRAALAADLADAIAQPSAAVAAALLQWQHDDVAGSGVRRLAGTTSIDVVEAMTLDNAELLGSEIGVWVEGIAAAHNPALGAQLAAAASGRPGAELVPRDGMGQALLASFPVGSELAALQVARDPGLGTRGQLALRITGPVPSARSVRFDAAPGDVAVLVDRFDITLTDGEGATVTIDGSTALDGPGIRGLGPRRYAQPAGGHVVVPLSGDLAGGPCRVDAVVVFRRWPLDADDPALRTPLPVSAMRRARRLARRVPRPGPPAPGRDS